MRLQKVWDQNAWLLNAVRSMAFKVIERDFIFSACFRLICNAARLLMTSHSSDPHHGGPDGESGPLLIFPDKLTHKLGCSCQDLCLCPCQTV